MIQWYWASGIAALTFFLGFYVRGWLVREREIQLEQMTFNISLIRAELTSLLREQEEKL